ncbi:MAG: DUF4350 domain-containing protein [Thermoguttaceae bacterium]|jgi:hypothetical protein
MLAWIGLALLSVSWLVGLGYYHGANPRAWAVTVAVGTVLLATRQFRLPDGKIAALALALVAPAVWLSVRLMPWPYCAAPALIAAGLACALAAGPRTPLGRFLAAAGRTCLLAGCILLSQSLAMWLYEVATSRAHELPCLLPQLLAAVLAALGVDAAAHGTTVAVFSMRQSHLFAATWELLLDPPTWCFIVGGMVLLWCKNGAGLPCRRQLRRWARPAAGLLLPIALWLPFRAALLVAIYLDGVLRTDYEAPLNSMKLLWNPWLLLALLAGPVLLAWRFARTRGEDLEGSNPISNPRSQISARPLSVVLAVTAAALVGFGVYWEPVGNRKDGRVLIEECPPAKGDVWERTDKPYDTAWYGNMSGYNYYCIFDYCGRYYHVSRLTKPVDDAALAQCDVLVLKIPTRPYSAAEIDAITRFVAGGGGLMMIGEHTDVFGSGTALNSVAEKLGFSFRFDCLFGVDSVFEEHYDQPLAPHPMIQYMPALDFAISCSIDPGTSSGRAVIRNVGLKNLTADYHADNYYPQPDDSAEMQYGAFIQLWAARFGQGRVAAFTDSTLFSNFCAFEPGNSELMLGMIEWLNHQGGPVQARPWLLAAGLAVALAALWMARGWQSGGILLVAAGLLGWTSAALGSRALHRYACPSPPRVRPMREVVVDRTLCDCPLSKSGFIEVRDDMPAGFGIFERWILRLGYFTSRRSGPDVFSGNAIVFFHPHKAPPAGFVDKLANYVRGGGKVLVVDSPENTGSTAGELLRPFGLALEPAAAASGPLVTRAGWPSIPITSAAAVGGGVPLAWAGGRPVAAQLACGDGSVTVVGCGTRFTDVNMGVTGDVVPDDQLKAVYAVQFALLRAVVEGRLSGGSLPGAPRHEERVPPKNPKQP